jgi:pimeloyl-ACP methyl ester carboxylesterase
MKHKLPVTNVVSGPAGKLIATTEGDGGLPVLFVHDNAADRTHWADTQHAMQSRTVAFDLRGLGESEGRSGPFNVEAAVEDVAAVADSLLPERLVLVGHGFGAAVAGAFAVYFPERLAGLLLVEAGGDMRSTPPAEREALLSSFSAEKYGAFHEHWLAPLLAEAQPATQALVTKTLRTSRREAVAGYLESLYRFDPGETFEGFSGPTHALAATTGPSTLVAQRPALSLSVAPHASHWLMLDSPQWFRGELSLFVGRCSRSR